MDHAGIYRLPSQNERELFGDLGKVLDMYMMRSDNLIIIGDFNTEEDDDSISNFMNLCALGKLIKAPTCILNTQSKNLQFNKTYFHQRYHWEHDRHGYPK